MRNLTDRSSRRRWMALLVAVAFASGLQGCSKESGGVSPPHSSPGGASTAARDTAGAASVSSSRVAAQWRGDAETFRLMASVDLGNALRRFGTPGANLQWASEGGAWAPSLGWRAAWEVFLSTALPQVVRARPDSALIGYHHPWSDVMLLTLWKKTAQGESRIDTIQLVPGGAIRGDAQVDAVPRKWQQGDVFAPEAVGQLTAQTALAFEARFGEASADPLAPMGADEKNSLAGFAGLAYADFCRETLAAHGDGQAQPAVMWLWQGLRDEAQGGQTSRGGSLGAGIKAIGRLGPRVLASFTPVSYLSTDKAELLMLASTLQPNLFVLVQTGGSEGRDSLRRVDLLSFQAFYAAQTGVAK